MGVLVHSLIWKQRSGSQISNDRFVILPINEQNIHWWLGTPPWPARNDITLLAGVSKFYWTDFILWFYDLWCFMFLRRRPANLSVVQFMTRFSRWLLFQLRLGNNKFSATRWVELTWSDFFLFSYEFSPCFGLITSLKIWELLRSRQTVQWIRHLTPKPLHRLPKARVLTMFDSHPPIFQFSECEKPIHILKASKHKEIMKFLGWFDLFGLDLP